MHHLSLSLSRRCRSTSVLSQLQECLAYNPTRILALAGSPSSTLYLPRDFASNADIPVKPVISRRPMLSFLKRTEGVKKILDLFGSFSIWDDVETPRALNSLGVPFHRYIVSEVIRKSVRIDIALYFFNWLSTRNDFEPDSYVYNSLIHRLGKAGKFEEMESVASLVISKGKANNATFTSLISGFKIAMEHDKALQAWSQMKELGFKPCHTTYAIMIDLFASMNMYEKAGEYYLELLNDNLRPNIKICTILINHLVMAEKLDAALEMFKGLLKVNLKPNPVTYVSIMLGYVKSGDVDTMLRLVRDFKEYGHSPNGLGNSFISVLKYLVLEGRIEDAKRVMKEGWPESSAEDRKIKLLEFKEDALGHSSSIECAEMDPANDCEDGDDDDVILYTSSDASSLLNLKAFVRCLFPWTLATARALDNAKLRWDCYFVSKVLNRLQRAGPGWKFYCWVAKQPGYTHDKYTRHRMIKLFLRDQGFPRVKRLIFEAHNENITLPLHAYASVLKHCGMQKESEFALTVFDILKKTGLKPDETCYKYLIHALFKGNRYWRVATVCSEMKKAGFPLDSTTYSLLITGFAGAGKLDIVKKLLKQMRVSNIEVDVYVYKALIKAYYRKGRLEKAKQVYRMMRRVGIEASPQINEIMVDIFSELGDHERACKIKDKMRRMVPPSGLAKKARLNQYLQFHSMFVKQLARSECPLAMVAR